LVYPNGPCKKYNKHQLKTNTKPSIIIGKKRGKNNVGVMILKINKRKMNNKKNKIKGAGKEKLKKQG
jgi:hypothetical protein